MYSGRVGSYVRCEECHNESLNEMDFMDLSLPINNEFGTGVLNSSLQMALENYIKPEKLEGDNKYNCERCSKKVDAEKGLKLTKCPPVLFIHLARFTLDWDTMQRVKIYDSVSFPFILNMNDYLKGYEGIQNKLYEKEVVRMRQYCESAILKNKQEEEKHAAKRNACQETVVVAETAPAEKGEEIMIVDTSSKKKEMGVKINIGEAQPEERVVTEQDYSDNPYMYDTRGPKKVINYSNVEQDQYID